MRAGGPVVAELLPQEAADAMSGPPESKETALFAELRANDQHPGTRNDVQGAGGGYCELPAVLAIP